MKSIHKNTNIFITSLVSINTDVYVKHLHPYRFMLLYFISCSAPGLKSSENISIAFINESQLFCSGSKITISPILFTNWERQNHNHITQNHICIVKTIYLSHFIIFRNMFHFNHGNLLPCIFIIKFLRYFVIATIYHYNKIRQKWNFILPDFGCFLIFNLLLQ